VVRRTPRLIGINGAQGSGKTTLCRFLETLLVEHNLRTVTLSLDDLYLTHSRTAGPGPARAPAVRDPRRPRHARRALGEAILDDLLAGRTAALPRFDKAVDDRAAVRRMIDRRSTWCCSKAGASAPCRNRRGAGSAGQCARTVRGCRRRLAREVNRRLATDYAELFARIDLLVMLKVEAFEAVRANRALQEQSSRRAIPRARRSWTTPRSTAS
jgi:D-glycerate 3-kinase